MTTIGESEIEQAAVSWPRRATAKAGVRGSWGSNVSNVHGGGSD